MNKICFFLFFLNLLTVSINAQDTSRVAYAVRVDHLPNVDGKASDELWQSATPFGDFIQVRPNEGQPSTLRTEIRIVYTDYAVYVLAQLFDAEPDSICKQLGKRDAEDLNADNFFIKLDTYDKHQDAYVFGVSASGVQYDSRFSDVTYDAVWKSAVTINQDGWVVEMEIPFSAIRFPKNEIQRWGLQFNRSIRRTRELDFWAYVPSIATNAQLYWGHLEGIKNIETPLRLSLTPYLSAGYENAPQFKDNGDYSYSNTLSYNAGADIKYGIDDRFTLDMTLFPDFGQVQSDKTVKNLSYVEVVYDEARPFFQEGTELFSTGDLFYSRRIGRTPGGFYTVFDNLQDGETVRKNPAQAKLLNAIKISGRTDGGTGLGFFNAVTDNMYAVVENTEGKSRKILTEPMTNYNILVADHQFKNNSSVFLVNTSTLRSKGYDDAMVTAGGFSISNKKNRFAIIGKGWMNNQYTTVEKENENQHETIQGYKYELGAEKLGGSFLYGAVRIVTDRNFNTSDLGYYIIPGQIENNAFFKYNTYKPGKIFRETYNTLNLSYNTDYTTGKPGSNEIKFNFFGTLLSYNALFLGGGAQEIRPYDYYESRTEGRVYHQLRYYYFFTGVSSDYRKRVAIDYEFNVSNFQDEYKSEGFNNSISFRIRPSDHLFLIYKFSYDTDPFNLGYANNDVNGDIIFGGRKLETFVNELNGTYIFVNDMSFILNARHYWSTGAYKKYFTLLLDGELSDNLTYHENNNFSFNVFNIDLVYEWRFAPGSVLNIIYKNGIQQETNSFNRNFKENFSDLMHAPSTNTFSIKVLYYLDYQKLHNLKSKHA
ncbi:hypothetical protein BH11BAC2_BH11BAC2_11270 [soil metagenome]